LVPTLGKTALNSHVNFIGRAHSINVHVVSERTQGLHSMAVHGTNVPVVDALKTTLFLSGKSLYLMPLSLKKNRHFFLLLKGTLTRDILAIFTIFNIKSVFFCVR
jgi:hypothetical protein